ncbi:HAD hydrolase-like protein [Catellatospora sp. KI3]|uniref:HAD family hydrolase n=1 Tax=Catellatospora sp. KI3 TaxID=3041620 RepID=UPI0024831C09|nr:HAD hydrolase-like protein [Catellatospora sp. KI3]MDI1460140.1 HAD hydrolase-like protein [Catellatospora sp. KI3]
MGRHLVWDWNGTLLDDLQLVVASTNAAFATVPGPAGAVSVTVHEHRRDFRRPIHEYYGQVLGREVGLAEFAVLDRVFHDSYRTRLTTVELAADALAALAAWQGTQSLLSMWFHRELVPLVERYELTPHFLRVDGLRDDTDGGFKAIHLKRHLAELRIDGANTVMIGDSIDDADAAASVGARCVLYAGGLTDPDRLRAYGVPVADSLVDAVAIATTLS